MDSSVCKSTDFKSQLHFARKRKITIQGAKLSDRIDSPVSQTTALSLEVGG